MAEFRKLLCIVGVIVLILAPLTSMGVGRAETDEPFVGEYDESYERTVERGEETTFSWTIEKEDSQPSHTVNIKTEGLEDLEKELTPERNFLLEDDQIVTLTVEVPLFPEDEKIEGSVIFSFSRGGELQNETERSVTINVSGLPDTAESDTILGGFRNPLPAPFDGPFGAFLLNLLIWLSIAAASFFLVTPFLYRLTKKTKTDFDELLVKMIRRPLFLFIFIYGFIHSLTRLELPFEMKAALYQLYSILALVIGIYVTYRLLDGVLDEISFKRGGESSPFAKVLKPLFEKLGLIVILLGGSIIGLRILGIEVTALLAGAGVLGLVVALAAQDTLSNFFSGMHLLLDRPFTVGDVLELEDGEYCRVMTVGMRSTKLYDMREHEMIVLPNNALANQKIRNLAEPDEKKRLLINVGVGYESDIEQVKKILYEILKDQEDVMTREGLESVVLFSDFGDSSLKFTLRFWIDDYLEQWKVASRIRERIDEEFREAKVSIPFPQRTVWLKEDD